MRLTTLAGSAMLALVVAFGASASEPYVPDPTQTQQQSVDQWYQKNKGDYSASQGSPAPGSEKGIIVDEKPAEFKPAEFKPADNSAVPGAEKGIIIVGGKGDPSAGESTVTNAALQALVSSGADEPVSFSLDPAVSGPLLTIAGVPVTSKGDAVSLREPIDLVEGVADLGGPNERVVFALTDNGNGTFTFDLVDVLDDAVNSDPGILTLDLTPAFTATDFDGDEVTLAPDAIQVIVENDVTEGTTASIKVQPQQADGKPGLSAGESTPGAEQGIIIVGGKGDPSAIDKALLGESLGTMDTGPLTAAQGVPATAIGNNPALGSAALGPPMSQRLFSPTAVPPAAVQGLRTTPGTQAKPAEFQPSSTTGLKGSQ